MPASPRQCSRCLSVVYVIGWVGNGDIHVMSSQFWHFNTTRLDPVCAHDSFGAPPCVFIRGRARTLRGSPYCLPRAIFTRIHVCISHMYIYMYTHMHITHVYLHTYTYVYHTPKTPRHAYESPSRVPRRSCALSSAALLLQDAGVCIDTHRKTCIGSRSFGKAFGG